MGAMADITRRDQVDMVSFSTAGIDAAAAEQARERIIEKVKGLDESFKVRTIRYLPSTRSEIPEKHLVEVLANLTVNVGNKKSKFGFVPSKIIQAVVSFEKNDNSLSLHDISISDAEFNDPE